MKKKMKNQWQITWAMENIDELDRYQGEQVLVHPVLGVLVHGSFKDFQFKVDTIKKSVRKRCRIFGATTLASSISISKVKPVKFVDAYVDPFETGYNDEDRSTGCFVKNTWVQGATVDDEYDAIRKEGF